MCNSFTLSRDIPQLLAGEYSITRVGVVGFPGARNGEKWGIVREIPTHMRESWTFKKHEEREVLTYDFIGTHPSQAGSPVMGMLSREAIGVHTGATASCS